ncbi:unnamed protein product, partial [marine sediment metagenome]
ALLSRLKNNPTEHLLVALEGIGEFLTSSDVSKFVDPLVRLSCSTSQFANKALDAIELEFLHTPTDLDKEIVKRLISWKDLFQEKNQDERSEIVEQMIKAVYDSDIPF